MKTICINVIAIFVSVRFLSAVLDVDNKHYVANLLLAVAEMFAFIGCLKIIF